MYAAVLARSWDEVKSIVLDRPGCVFRGQGRAEWQLETTLHREALRLNLGALGIEMLRGRESHLIQEFQRFAHHYLPVLPDDHDALAWLALIQHYGGPTRLLDFSYSPYVAAFFAVDNAASDAALWMIDRSSLEMASYNRLHHFPTGSISDLADANAMLLFGKKGPERDHPAVLHVEPSRLHERIWIQKGLFLAPTHPDKSFHANLLSAFFRRSERQLDKRPVRWNTALEQRTQTEFPDRSFVSVLKIILPRSIHGAILADLESMNNSSATLLPGLEGFARSLRHRIWPNSMWLHE
jgi:hypothetical protein